VPATHRRHRERCNGRHTHYGYDPTRSAWEPASAASQTVSRRYSSTAPTHHRPGTAATAQVTVAFTHPRANGGSAITAYTATCGSQTGSGSGVTITVTGLVNGTAVTFAWSCDQVLAIGAIDRATADTRQRSGCADTRYSNAGNAKHGNFAAPAVPVGRPLPGVFGLRPTSGKTEGNRTHRARRSSVPSSNGTPTPLSLRRPVCWNGRRVRCDRTANTSAYRARAHDWNATAPMPRVDCIHGASQAMGVRGTKLNSYLQSWRMTGSEQLAH